MTKQTRVFRTERIWLKATKQLRQLCHVSKNLYNEANYLVRQAYFNQKKWLKTYQFREELANSSNFQQLPIPTAKKVLWNVDKAWKSFFAMSSDWETNPETLAQTIYERAMNAVEADRIEVAGLHPSRWRLVTATS